MNNEINIQDYVKQWRDACESAQAEYDKAKRAHKRKEMEAVKFPYWFDMIIRPLANDLETITGLHAELYSPHGIFCKCNLYLYKDKHKTLHEQPYVYAIIHPKDLNEGSFCYETGEVLEKYPRGSLGEINGGNFVTAPMPNLLRGIVSTCFQGDADLLQEIKKKVYE